MDPGSEEEVKKKSPFLLEKDAELHRTVFGQRSSRHKWGIAQDLLAKDSLPAERDFRVRFGACFTTYLGFVN